jgi:hypothetical protein
MDKWELSLSTREHGGEMRVVEVCCGMVVFGMDGWDDSLWTIIS